MEVVIKTDGRYYLTSGSRIREGIGRIRDGLMPTSKFKAYALEKIYQELTEHEAKCFGISLDIDEIVALNGSSGTVKAYIENICNRYRYLRKD